MDHRLDKAKRTNFYDYNQERIQSPNSPYYWILQRIHEKTSTTTLSNDDDWTLLEFQQQIEFILLHEFDTTGFFDWHIDGGLPNDPNPTYRTRNVNVMLSSHDEGDYDGGHFAIGNHILTPHIGDLYTYRPFVPHQVMEITQGQRHTLVLSLQEQQRQSFNATLYWNEAQQLYQFICQHSVQAKVHMLHGKFLHAWIPDNHAAIDNAFAKAYAYTPRALGHVERFQQLAASAKQQQQQHDDDDDDDGDKDDHHKNNTAAIAAASFANMAQLIQMHMEELATMSTEQRQLIPVNTITMLQSNHHHNQ